MNDDTGGGLGKHSEVKPHGVGLLNEGGEETLLTAREACNKIIHSTGSRLAYVRGKDHPIYQHLLDRDRPHLKRRYIRPMLSLIGDRGKNRPWRATLDVVPWTHALLHWSTTFVKRRNFVDFHDVPAPQMREVLKQTKRLAKKK